MELEKTYNFRVDTGAQNENHALTLTALQRIIVTVSEEHLKNIGLDVPFLMKEFGVSWILLSLFAEIKSPVLPGELLSVRTWHTNKKGLYYRRDIEICHEDGSVAMVAATFSSVFGKRFHLFNNSRRIGVRWLFYGVFSVFNTNYPHFQGGNKSK